MKQEIEDEWFFWRPVVGGVLSLSEASQMYDDELMMVNLAMDKGLEVKYGN